MSDEIAHALAERVKELTALHSVATLLQDEQHTSRELLERIAALLPPAFQFPHVATARIEYDGSVAASGTLALSPRTLSAAFATADGRAGRIEVAYTEGPTGQAYPFLDEEQRLLTSIARMMESALNRRLAEAEARRVTAALEQTLAATEADRTRVQTLLEIANAVGSQLDLPALLSATSQILVRVVPHHFVSATLWDADAGTLRRHALIFEHSQGRVQDGALLRTDRLTPARVTFDRGQTMIFRTAEIEALGEHSQAVMKAENLAAACCIPLRARRGIVGTINFGSPRADAFPPDEVRMLEQIVGQLSIAVDNALAYREISDLKDRLTQERQYLADEVSGHDEFRDIVGGSEALTQVLHQIRAVAATDATVLLLGETGTGKELLARAIHEASRRRQQSFVRINSAALPATLVESELFGYERGAFTGATASKAGRFELAHRGTLFLDEIGETPLEVQPKLLRALQEQEFERLGGTRTVRVDVRLVAATNRDLGQMAEQGAFRKDLFYRLSVFPITVPPLRERPSDIGPLVRHFARRFAGELGQSIAGIPASTLEAFEQWSWPGNIRELQNVVERAVILSRGGELAVPPGAFPSGAATSRRAVAEPPERAEMAAVPEPIAERADSRGLYEDHERSMILRALREANGVIAGPTGAAARLGLKRTTLQSKMRKLGIIRPSF